MFPSICENSICDLMAGLRPGGGGMVLLREGVGRSGGGGWCCCAATLGLCLFH